MLVDVHCHLTHALFENDTDSVIQRAREAGVKRIVSAGTNKKTNRAVMALLHKYPDIVRASLGVYPLDAIGIEDGMQGPEEDVDEEIEFIRNNKDRIVAIGEVGMDFSQTQQRTKQFGVFKKFIQLSHKIDKPLIVHSRKAEKEVVDVLGMYPVKAVLHCFSGRKNLVKTAAEDGHYFSIPPILERSSHFAMVVKEVNINQLLTETDSPWLSPTKERNEPANVANTIKCIASIKGMDAKEVENNIFLNYQRLFKEG